MMSNENTEEKRPEEQALPELWVWEQYDKIQEAFDANKSASEIRILLDQLFSGLTEENFLLTGSYGKEIRKQFEELGKDFGKLFKDKNGRFAWVFAFESDFDIIKELWYSWVKNRELKNIKDQDTVDYIALYCLIGLDNDTTNKLYEEVKGDDFNFYHLEGLGKSQYKENPFILRFIGHILSSLEGKDSYRKLFSVSGMEFLSQAQILQLKQEVIEPFKKSADEREKKLEALKDTTEEEFSKLDKRVKKSEEELKTTEQRSIRNFVQVIGIFAAIIAFIVTIVPTAVRLGGASIPVALAGLAIVTAGIIILLAMIFGREEKEERRRALRKGFWGAIGAFGAWLILTLILAFAQPNVLRPPPDPVRVDTLYIDTVDTTPPPYPPPPGRGIKRIRPRSRGR
jgi:hypothetical protein